uniref:Uncharacterized protein n=1 Tax=Oryza brachyantha TaxID=4533 RepID=J3MR18_ORYBR
MAQLAARITMEVAPPKLSSIIRRTRLPRKLDTIMEDDKETMESPRASSRSTSYTKETGDTSMHYTKKGVFLASMMKAGCLKIKA